MLANGEWRAREEVVLSAMRLVPPGFATRVRAKNGNTGVREVNLQMRIRIGARESTNSALYNAIRNGTIQQRVSKGIPQIRLRPERGQR